MLLRYHKFFKKIILIFRTFGFLPIEAFFLSAIYRFFILNIKFEKLAKILGNQVKEGNYEGTKEGYILAKKISLVVNKISQFTPWESKCLVKAMITQRMMNRRGYRVTIYLGIGKDSEGINAHSWSRYGSIYITGGSGEKYAKVASFFR